MLKPIWLPTLPYFQPKGIAAFPYALNDFRLTMTVTEHTNEKNVSEVLDKLC